MRYPTLTRNNDFRRAYARGRSYVGYSLVLYVMKNRTGKTRIGITSSKKIGNAVTRNRARRVIRAALAAVLPPEGVGGFDLVLVARASTAAQKSTQTASVLRKLLTKANLPALPKESMDSQPLCAAGETAAAAPAPAQTDPCVSGTSSLPEGQAAVCVSSPQGSASAESAAPGSSAVSSQPAAAGASPLPAEREFER